MFDPDLAERRRLRATKRLRRLFPASSVQRDLEDGLRRRLLDFRNFTPARIAVAGSHTPSFDASLQGLWRPPPSCGPFPEAPAPVFDGGPGEHNAHPPLNQADLVVLCNNAHHINDLPGYLIQSHLFLTTGGLLMGAVFGEGTLQELEGAILQTEASLYARAVPRCEPKLDIKTLGALLQRAGFHNPVVDKETYRVRYTHLVDLASDIRTLNLSPALEGPPLPSVSREFWGHVEEQLRHPGGGSTDTGRSTDKQSAAGVDAFTITFDILYFMGQKVLPSV